MQLFLGAQHLVSKTLRASWTAGSEPCLALSHGEVLGGTGEGMGYKEGSLSLSSFPMAPLMDSFINSSISKLIKYQQCRSSTKLLPRVLRQ